MRASSTTSSATRSSILGVVRRATSVELTLHLDPLAELLEIALGRLLVRIRDVRGADPAKPLLTEMEHTLTDGYARALELEAERLRLERRIGELAHNLDGPKQARELRRLALDLEGIDESLTSLRDVLAALQQHVDQARAAA